MCTLCTQSLEIRSGLKKGEGVNIKISDCQGGTQRNPPRTHTHTHRKAKLLLKKKRYLESLLDKTDQQLDNLQQMVDNLEFTQIEMKVVEGLKTGNECLEQMHKIMSLEDVEQIMSDTQEAIEYQRVSLIIITSSFQ